MPVFKPRNRLVNFRLSEEEFAQLRATCSQFGARSLSDFARSAVLRSVSGETAGAPASDGHLTVLDRKVNDLEGRVSELIQLIQHLQGAEADKPTLPYAAQQVIRLSSAEQD
jgi:hypothetical protein